MKTKNSERRQHCMYSWVWNFW